MYRRLVLVLLSAGVLFGLNGIDAPRVADAQRVPPGGAPVAGTGTKQTKSNIRVIDGDTIETWLDGQQSGVGLIGINAARANAQCGQMAIGKMYSLVKQGLRLEEDPNITFDARGRRMYQAYTKDGALLAEEMVKAGFAKPGAQRDLVRSARQAGRELTRLRAADAEAVAAGRGCATRFEPSTRDAVGANDVSGSSGSAASFGLALPLFELGDAIQVARESLDPRGLLIPSTADAAVSMPSGFTQDVVAQIDTMTQGQPTAFAFLPDGRILITMKNGLVRIVKNGDLLATPFIDLRDRVNDYWDHGLLGVEVDPNFPSNGYVYFTYTYENDAGNHAGLKTARLARYTAIGDTASTATELVLLGTTVGNSCNDFPVGADCIPSDSPSHSIGTVKFGSDGTLFVTTGDGAHFNFVDDNALRAQNLDTLSGKVLRITPTGQGLSDNPFWNGNPNSNRSKVWAYGLRNPYRFNMRPGTDVAYIGDVGWNTWEKVSAAPKGANLGWPCYEANVRQAGYEPKSVCQTLYAQGANAVQFPLTAWDHGGASSAATGGTFYNGTTYPSSLHGAYFYADYGQNFIRTLKVDANNQLVPDSITGFATGADAPVDIESGPDQNIYYLSITTGQLRKIRYTVGNTPPAAIASVTPASGLVPLPVQFSSAGTVDPDGDPLTYSWNFGDGSATSTEANPQHTYTTSGTFTATLTVTDSRGADASTTVKVGAGNRPPVPSIGTPSASLRYKVGDVIAFSGAATDPEDGSLPGTALSWQINIKHCPYGVCHTHPFQSAIGLSGAFTVPDHGDDSNFEIVLTATDSGGLYTSTNLILEPQTVQLTLATSPSWQRVVYDGESGLSPLTRTTVVGSAHTIYTNSPQAGATFSSWSDGGAQQHNITVGSSDTTHTATFNVTPRSLAFGGNAAYAEAAHRADINPTGDWTIETWFKDETPGGYNHQPGYMIIKEDTAFSGDIPYQMWIEWGTLFVGQRTSWTQQLVSYPLGSVSANQWHHAAVTLQASTRTLRLYVDGVQVAQGTLPAITTNGNRGPLRIGANVIPGAYWRGKLDDVRIWNVTRSAADITASFQRQLNGAPVGLVGHWRMDEGSGAIAADTAGEPQDLMLVAGAAWSSDAPGIADTTPPTITTITENNVSSSAATIGWTTDEPADSQVEYGTTASYGSSSPLASAPVATHAVALTGLTPNTLYHYRVKSRDSAGNLATSGDRTFTTEAPRGCPCTIWDASATPAVAAQVDSNPIELGVKFRSEQAGYISGIRFYKGAGNSGTHIGSLWNTLGTRLAQATFTNETATGWQQVNFATPVAISANTTYVASYFAPNGHYARNESGFAGAAVDNAPLRALADGSDGPNGLYLYAATSSFPTNSFNATNYWVDVVFTTTPPALDTTPPTISAVQATGVSNSAATIGWTTNEAADSQVEYGTSTAYGSSSALETALVAIHSVGLTGLAPSTTYHYRVKSRDAAGNLATSADGTFTTAETGPAGPNCPCSIWSGTATPEVASDGETGAVELGVKFRSDQAGYISGIRFYKGPTNTGTHIGNLWSSTGTRLAQATFSGETATGWQQVSFASPVAITANTTYVASYHAPSGGFATTRNAFGTAGVDNAPLHALRDGTDGGNGVFRFGASAFPNQSYQATNYWVDVVFSTTPPAADTTPPVISGVQSSGISGSGATIGWSTNEGADSQVEYGPTTAYGSATTLDPALVTSHSVALVGLNAGTTYHYRVKSRDAAGNLATSGDFTFTTGAAPTCPCSIWSTSATPAIASQSDTGAVELGVKFRSDSAGYIRGIRFYKGPANTGTRVGSLWSSTGTRLANATFSGETASGWQTVMFATPVQVQAGVTYTASYHAPNGGYSRNEFGFTDAGVDNAPLHALRSGVDGPNGLYAYGPAGTFPTNSYNATNYWVDVIFATTP